MWQMIKWVLNPSNIDYFWTPLACLSQCFCSGSKGAWETVVPPALSQGFFFDGKSRLPLLFDHPYPLISPYEWLRKEWTAQSKHLFSRMNTNLYSLTGGKTLLHRAIFMHAHRCEIRKFAIAHKNMVLKFPDWRNDNTNTLMKLIGSCLI